MAVDLTEFEQARLFMSLPNPYIVFRADDDLTIVEQNDAHQKVALVKRGQVIGKPVLEAFPDTSEKYVKTGVSDLVESMRKVIRTAKPDTMPLLKYDLRDDKGRFVERWWKVTHYPVCDDKHNVILVYQATEDITNEMKAQADLNRTEAMLKSAQEFGIVSTFSWDMKNNVVIGDANLARTFGVSDEEARAGLPIQTFINSIHPDDRDLVNAAITKTIEQKKPYKTDYRTIRADKTISWVTGVGKVIADENDVPRYFNGLLIDITDRKEFESRLAEAEQRFKALFDSNVAGIATVTMDGRVLHANPLFLKLFGYTKADLKKGVITSTMLSQVPNDPVSRGIYESLRATGQSEPVRKKYRRKDGTSLTGLVGAAMLPGKRNEFVAFVLDVTENEKLKELNIVKDDFIAMASHQLRTPASTVKQYLGILINEYAGELNADQLQYANIANDANEREITIIEDLLKTAQIDIEGYNLNLIPLNVITVLRNVVKQYEPAVAVKKQQLRFEPKKSVIVVRADEAELSICIANLIENASKYSGSGKVIDVSVKVTKSVCTISVTDQGVGISESDYDKIFQKFTRVDNELSDTVTGSGLGLYWVKRIIELHKGTLTIQSKIGKGTTISIELPI